MQATGISEYMPDIRDATTSILHALQYMCPIAEATAGAATEDEATITSTGMSSSTTVHHTTACATVGTKVIYTIDKTTTQAAVRHTSP